MRKTISRDSAGICKESAYIDCAVAFVSQGCKACNSSSSKTLPLGLRWFQSSCVTARFGSPKLAVIESVRSIETDSFIVHFGEEGANTVGICILLWPKACEGSSGGGSVAVISYPNRPSIFSIKGFKYRDSLPRMLDSLLMRMFKYCLPSENVAELSPAVHLSTSARHPAMSDSFCSYAMSVSAL